MILRILLVTILPIPFCFCVVHHTPIPIKTLSVSSTGSYAVTPAESGKGSGFVDKYKGKFVKRYIDYTTLALFNSSSFLFIWSKLRFTFFS
jgi:hypothetical protein